MTKPIDKDILAIKQAAKALMGSTSARMLFSNLQFLHNYFIVSPSKSVMDKFHSDLLKYPEKKEG